MKGKRIKYSQDELDWVRQNSHLPRRNLAQQFAKTFKRGDVSEANIRALCTRKGWSAGEEGRRRNKGKSFLFTPDQIRWLHENATLSRKDAHREFSNAFPDSGITLNQIVSFRKNHGLKTGRTGRFEKGRTSWNKGKKIGSHPNCRATQFKKGQLPHNTKYLGHERTNRDGYIEISVGERNPHTGFERRYVHKHRWLWEKKYGPIPEGHVLKCLDGDKTNCDPSNWCCIPQAMLPRLNGRFGRGFDTAEPELKPLIMATAKLEHEARELRKGDDK